MAARVLAARSLASGPASPLGALAAGGSLILYTGAAVVAGSIPLVDLLVCLCNNAHAALQIEEIDPDVFGEELDRTAYRTVERIAVLVIKMTKN